MIARVTRYQVAAGQVDETIEDFRNRRVPTARPRRGYRRGYLLIDRKTGNCITVAFWDAEKDAIADEDSGEYQRRIDFGKDLYTVLPVRELYEVIEEQTKA